jgi:hypothetical protein
MKKIIVGIVICVMSGFSAVSQNILPSNTFVQTNYHNHECFANEDASYIFYNEASHELNIIIDFAKCRVGHDTIDEWLDDIDDNKLYLKAKINSDRLLVLTNSNSKTIEVDAKIKLNNVIVNDNVDVTFFEISQNGMLYNNNGNDYYDRIRANIQVELSPKYFKLDKNKHKLKNTITISIGRGYINQFKPGMEDWIGDNF